MLGLASIISSYSIGPQSTRKPLLDRPGPQTHGSTTACLLTDRRLWSPLIHHLFDSPTMSEELKEEERLFRERYGNKLPTRAEILKNQLKQRRFFDSGDYAMSKAGKPVEEVGSEHPVPEHIPHREAALAYIGASPVRRSSCLAPHKDAT